MKWLLRNRCKPNRTEDRKSIARVSLNRRMGFDRCGESNISLQPEKYLWIEELHGLQIDQLSLILALPVASFRRLPWRVCAVRTCCIIDFYRPFWINIQDRVLAWMRIFPSPLNKEVKLPLGWPILQSKTAIYRGRKVSCTKVHPWILHLKKETRITRSNIRFIFFIFSVLVGTRRLSHY